MHQPKAMVTTKPEGVSEGYPILAAAIYPAGEDRTRLVPPPALATKEHDGLAAQGQPTPCSQLLRTYLD